MATWNVAANCDSKDITTKGLVRVDLSHKEGTEVQSFFSQDATKKTMYLEDACYDVFTALAGTNNVLELSDLKNINSVHTKYKQYIEKITPKMDEGEVTIEFKNGYTMTVDFVTKDEEIPEDSEKYRQSRLTAQQKIDLANKNGFGEYYDLKPSSDGKYIILKVKDSGIFTQNPTLDTIKSDFGIASGVLVNKGEIPYGNQEVIEKRAKPGSTADGRNTDYDAAKLLPGDKLNIPLEEVKISDSPRGFWGRLFQDQ